MKLQLIICLFGILLWNPQAFSQFQLLIESDTNVMQIGDIQNFSLNITCHKSIENFEFNFDSIKEMPGFELFDSDQYQWNIKVIGDSKILNRDVPFMAFEPGNYIIPSVKYQFEQDNVIKQGETKPFSLKVLPATSQDTTLMDIKPILIEGRNAEDYIFWLAIVLFVLVIIIVVYYFFKKRAKNKKITNPEILVSPREQALVALNELKASEKWADNNPYEFQTELSNIVRTFLQNQYQVKSLESTTLKIVNQVKGHKNLNIFAESIQNALNLADLVKFAKQDLREEMQLNMLEKMITFVSFDFLIDQKNPKN